MWNLVGLPLAGTCVPQTGDRVHQAGGRLPQADGCVPQAGGRGFLLPLVQYSIRHRLLCTILAVLKLVESETTGKV